MINPFTYGGIVGSDDFCDRVSEQEDLLRAAENGDRIFVYAERRMGKTSLIKRVIDRLDRRSFAPVYVDLWPTNDTESFITATARALAASATTRTDRLLKMAGETFSRLQPSLTFDEAGNPSLQFGLRQKTEETPALEEVLQAPAKLVRTLKRRLVIVFDEFQQLTNYKDDLVERTIRSAIQQPAEVAYFFLGSRKHLIGQLFSDSGRPLYRSAGHYPLGTIDTEHWQPFIGNRFKQADKHISSRLVESLCSLTDGHPFYTQFLCHALWERALPGAEITDDQLEEALNLLLSREHYVFATRWETLTRNQQQFLKALVENPGLAPFSSEFAAVSKLGSPASAQRAAESLLKLDLIDRSNGSYVITDRFLKLWIRRTIR